MALDLIARRQGSDFLIFCNGAQVGRFADCEVTHVYEGEFQNEISEGMEPDFSVRERLAHVRKVLEALVSGRKGTFTAEQLADEGMRRKAVAKALRDRDAYRDAERTVEQACAAIRARGAHWMPPTAVSQ